jgi:hypothetical protein
MLFYNHGMKCGNQIKKDDPIPVILINVFSMFLNDSSGSGLIAALVGIVGAPGTYIDQRKF